MSDFTSLEKSASVAFRPNGIYRGIVTRIDAATRRVWVRIPRVSTTAEFGWDNGLPTVSLTLPNVNDMVGCVFTENRAEELIVIGTIRNSSSLLYAPPVACTSTTRPESGEVEEGTFIYETDTEKVYVWNGAAWVGLSLGGTTVTGRVYLNDFGVGVGAESVGESVSVQTPVTYTSATLSGASAGRSGLVRIGTNSGNHIVVDGDLIQAKDNATTAGELRLNPLGGQVTVAGTLQASTLQGAINAGLLTSGTVPSARLAGVYDGITGVGTLANLTVAGTVTAAASGGTNGKIRINPVSGGVVQFDNAAGVFKLGVEVSGVVNEVFRATHDATGGWLRINSSNIAIGSWSASSNSYNGLMAEHSDGKRYYMAMAQTSGGTTQTLSTFIGARPGGYVYVRPDNNNSNRQLVLTNTGDWNGTKSGTTQSGHVLYGRLTFRSDGVTTPGAWFADAGGEVRTFLGHKDSAATGVGFFSSAIGKWVLTVNDGNGAVLIGADNATFGGTNGRISLSIPSNAGGDNTLSIDFLGQVYKNTSLRETKENIVDISNALNAIDLLRPRYFTVKPDPYSENKENDVLYSLDRRAGFIVEEIEEVDDRLIEYGLDGTGNTWDNMTPKYYRPTDIAALSVAAIKELKAQVELLEQRIDELES